MRECPTIHDLAAFVEGSLASESLQEHVSHCAACTASLNTLRGEVHTLQISITELWFQERISCPSGAQLHDWQGGHLSGSQAEYVSFHVNTLLCPFCLSQVGEEEISRDPVKEQACSRSRQKVGEATAVFLQALKKRS